MRLKINYLKLITIIKKKEFYGNFNKSRPLQRNLLILLHTNVYTNILLFFQFCHI